MSFVYTINSIGLDLVFFSNKRSALNYAIKHNLPKLRDNRYGIVKTRTNIADEVRIDFLKIKQERNSQNNCVHLP